LLQDYSRTNAKFSYDVNSVSAYCGLFCPPLNAILGMNEMIMREAGGVKLSEAGKAKALRTKFAGLFGNEYIMECVCRLLLDLS